MNTISRRQALQTLSALLFLPGDLPLITPGLEHVGLTVPNPEETAKFYGRIFNPQLFRERDAPPRYYVTAGTAYMAFGGMPTATPRIDHFCALVQDYKAQDMRKALEEQGLTMAGPGMIGDPDGLRLQLLNVPGGLAGTIVPGGRISLEPAAVHAIGMDHIMLLVSDLDRSAAFYRKFFGMEESRTTKPARVWFRAGKTRLGLELAPSGQQPRIDHCCLTVASFDRRAMQQLGAELTTSNDEKLFRFRDPHGIQWELKPGV
jgi:catechol 2,3-dioxygenase-like lactoylglutathione lyase family enzyme